MSTVNRPPKPSPGRAARAPLPDGHDESLDSRLGTLTRQDIALAIYNRVGGMSRREAKRIIDSVIDEMVSTLTSGESLKLHDFGSFVVRDKGKRAGRNPRTGSPVPIQARRVIVFKASPNMKAAINGDEPPRRGANAAARRMTAVQKGETIALDPVLD